MRTRNIIILTLLLSALLFVILSSRPLTNEIDYYTNVTKAVSFLKDVQYNPDIGLLQESPNMLQNRYGIQSDNVLAWLALEDYYPSISTSIYDEIIELGYLRNSKYEAVFNGKTPPLPFIIQEFKDIKNVTLYDDNFDRVSPGGNWARTGGNWQIADDRLNGSDGKEIYYYNQEKMEDGFVTAKVKIESGENPYIGLVQRMRADDEFIVLWLNLVGGGELKIQEQNASGTFNIDWTSYPIEVGEEYTIWFELSENIHRVWVNDFSEYAEPILQASSSINTTKGYCGVMVDSGMVGVFDDFKMIDDIIYNGFDSSEKQTDYETYSDLCFIASAIRWNQGRRAESIHLFEKGLSYWDGQGFNDTHRTTDYNVYQLAISLSVANLIEYDLGSMRNSMEIAIWSLQNEDGGIPTNYKSIGEYSDMGKEANTETTALAILIYKNAYR